MVRNNTAYQQSAPVVGVTSSERAIPAAIVIFGDARGDHASTIAASKARRSRTSIGGTAPTKCVLRSKWTVQDLTPFLL
jgi:hypothetical protein